MSNFILAIGIDDYKSCTKLNNAVKDILNITDTLTSKYDFDKKNIIKLLNEDASLENIINELEVLISKQNAGDNLIILFSGHGEYDDILEMGYLIPFESIPYSKSTYLPYSTLFSYVKALKSHHIVLISDSCYSGSVFNPIRSNIETSKEKLDKIPSKWAITSGRIEPVSDGIPGTNSPFAEAFLKILDDNKEDLISISEISNKIIGEVAGKLDQIPRGEPLQSYGHKGGEFIFRKRITTKISKIQDIEIESDDISSDLKGLINYHYELETKIEDAENENKAGTIRRLDKEKESFKNILNKELIKELEIKRSNLSKNPTVDILSKDYMTKYQELLLVRNEKNEVVKLQKYNLAAELRDNEKKLEKELNELLDRNSLNEFIKLSPESLYKDYFIVKIVQDMNGNYKFEKKELIEQLFAKILFWDLSFNNKNVSQYLYIDQREKLLKVLKEQF